MIQESGLCLMFEGDLKVKNGRCIYREIVKIFRGNEMVMRDEAI